MRVDLRLLVYRARHVVMLVHVNLLFLPAFGTVTSLLLPTMSQYTTNDNIAS